MSKVFFLTTALFFIALVNSQIYNPNAFAGCDCGAPTSTCICYCDAATSYTNATMFNGTVGSNPSVFGGWMELIPVGFIGYFNYFFVGNANENGGTSGLTAWGVSSSNSQTTSEFARYLPEVLRGSLSYYIDFPPTTDGQIMAIGTSACTLSSSGTGNLLVNGQDVVGFKASTNGMNVVQTWPIDRSLFDFSLNVVGGSSVSLNNVAAPPGGFNNYFYLRSINNGVPAYLTNLKLCTIACDSVQSFNISNGISGGSIFAFSSMNSFLYATGSFTTVNGQSANFAMYTGSSWTALAAFNVAPVTLAYARNRIFIGGSFSSYTKPGGSATACERFASIDSNGNIFCYTNGYNANGFVRTLKAVGDVIYIGGKLLPSNSAVWSYNAATLSFNDLGTNQPYSDGNGYVSAIESHNGEIHVALVCDTIYTAFRIPESISKFSTSSNAWVSIQNFTSQYTTIYAMASVGGELFVGGDSAFGSLRKMNAAGTWSQVAVQGNYFVVSKAPVSSTTDSLILGGDFANKFTWSGANLIPDAAIGAVFTKGNYLYFAGAFSQGIIGTFGCDVADISPFGTPQPTPPTPKPTLYPQPTPEPSPPSPPSPAPEPTPPTPAPEPTPPTPPTPPPAEPTTAAPTQSVGSDANSNIVYVALMVVVLVCALLF